MCEVLDRVQARGQAIGVKEGEERAKRQDALNLRAKLGLSSKQIADILELPTELIERWFNEQPQQAEPKH